MIRKYKLNLKNTEWEFEQNTETKYTKVYLVHTDKRRMHLHGVDMDACLQYVWAFYNKKDMPHIHLSDLEEVE